MPLAPKVTPDTFYAFLAQYHVFLKAFQAMRPVQRELDMLQCLERMLLHLRLAAGLGEPSARTPPVEDPTTSAPADPEVPPPPLPPNRAH